jgi:hypothetical protein
MSTYSCLDLKDVILLCLPLQFAQYIRSNMDTGEYKINIHAKGGLHGIDTMLSMYGAMLWPAIFF